MPHVALAHGLASRLVAEVVGLANLHRLHVTVFRNGKLGRREFAPPVRRVGLHGDLGALDDQVRLARMPRGAVLEHARHRHVLHVAARRAGIGPLRDLRDFCIAQRWIVLVVLNADVLFDVPRRHRALLVANRGARLHRARPRPRVLVGEERHRGHLAGPMAVLAAALQNRRDVPGKRDSVARLRRRRCGSGLLSAHRRREHRHTKHRRAGNHRQAKGLSNRHREAPWYSGFLRVSILPLRKP